MAKFTNFYRDLVSGLLTYLHGDENHLWKFEYDTLTKLTENGNDVLFYNSKFESYIVEINTDKKILIGDKTLYLDEYQFSTECNDCLVFFKSNEENTDIVIIDELTLSIRNVNIDTHVQSIYLDECGIPYGVGIQSGKYQLFYGNIVGLPSDELLEIHAPMGDECIMKINSAFLGIIYICLKVVDFDLFSLNSFQQVSYETIELNEPGTFLIKKQNTKVDEVVISFHGGPNSFETLDTRYGVLYQQALNLGYGIVIANYPGSTNFGDIYINKPNHQWLETISEYWGLLENKLEVIGISKIRLIGGSFGGMVTGIVSRYTNLNVQTVTFVAPLLNINTQINRANGSEYENWFTEKFSKSDMNNLNIDLFNDINAAQVNLIYGENDEVLGVEDYLQLISQFKNDGKKITVRIESESGHYPKTDKILEERNDFILRSVL